VLDYECRKTKESAYTAGQDEAAFETSLWKYAGVEPASFRKNKFVYDYVMSEITQSYRTAVENDLKNLKGKIEKNIGKSVNKVILSGGACVMNWVRKKVVEIFPNADIIEDRHPSFVVARGIAFYAQAQQRALEDLLKTLNQMDFADIYRKADIQATKDAIRELSKDAIEDVRKQPNCIKMVECFGSYIKSLDNNNIDYVTRVHSKVCDIVTQNVREALQNAFKIHFMWEFDASSINIDIDVDCTGWDSIMFRHNANGQDVDVKNTGTWSQTIMIAIQNILKRHKSFFTGTNWTKERSSEECNYISNELVNEVLKWTDWLEEVTYGEGNAFLEMQAESIKTQTKEIAKKLFYDNQLFRTTFSGNKGINKTTSTQN